jgi:hypothetical protein
LRKAKGSRFRSLTEIHFKRSLFEIAAMQRREMFTQILNASTLKIGSNAVCRTKKKYTFAPLKNNTL